MDIVSSLWRIRINVKRIIPSSYADYFDTCIQRNITHNRSGKVFISRAEPSGCRRIAGQVPRYLL